MHDNNRIYTEYMGRVARIVPNYGMYIDRDRVYGSKPDATNTPTKPIPIY